MAEHSKRTIAEIERDIALTRGDLIFAVRQLEERVRDELDWRRQVRARPWPFLAVAFLAGFYAATR
jgi:hypothetical protein